MLVKAGGSAKQCFSSFCFSFYKLSYLKFKISIQFRIDCAESKIHYIDEIVMQLVSLDQNTKEFVLNSKFFGIFKGICDKECIVASCGKDTSNKLQERVVVFNQVGHLKVQ